MTSKKKHLTDTTKCQTIHVSVSGFVDRCGGSAHVQCYFFKQTGTRRAKNAGNTGKGCHLTLAYP